MKDKRHDKERLDDPNTRGDRARYAHEHPAGYLLSQRATGAHMGPFGGLEHERAAWSVPYQERSRSLANEHPLHRSARVRPDGREHRGHPLLNDEAGYGAQGRLFAGGGRHPYELTGPGQRAPRAPKNYVRADEPIYEEIWERLIRLSELTLEDVTVRVADGSVTLSGHVPDRFSKYIIEEVSASVFGVRDVSNSLLVR